MSKFKLEIDIGGFNEIRRSAELQADLHRRAEAVVAATGSPGDFEVIDDPSTSRARVVVRTSTEEGRKLEAEQRALTKAFDAARG